MPAAGQAEWRGVLAGFWQPFDQNVQAAMGGSVTEVIDELDALLEPMLFPAVKLWSIAAPLEL